MNVERVQLDTDSYYIVSDPIYYSLLCLIETKDFNEDNKWMALRLKKTEAEVAEAMERLLRIGYVKRIEGKLTVGETHLATTNDVANMSLRLRHVENMNNAKEALLNLPVDDRYFRFETLAIGMDQMPEFKKAAQQFLDKLLVISQASQKDEVYEFTLGFFPRTVKEVPCSENTGTENGTDCTKTNEKINALH